MKRHYGLEIDDRVPFRGPGGATLIGKIIALYATDNNGGRIRLEDGRECNIVCEWCEVLPKTARCPYCGAAVDNVFDHVDRDSQCSPPGADGEFDWKTSRL